MDLRSGCLQSYTETGRITKIDPRGPRVAGVLLCCLGGSMLLFPVDQHALFSFMFIYFERESESTRVHEQGRGRESGRESQAGSMLSV